MQLQSKQTLCYLNVKLIWRDNAGKTLSIPEENKLTWWVFPMMLTTMSKRIRCLQFFKKLDVNYLCKTLSRVIDSRKTVIM